jgi:prepilin signal peptidase PulO-like enzyme (type II secretory pathway)
MDYQQIILVIVGGILGFASLTLAKALIKRRGENPSGKLFNGTLSVMIWTIVGMLIGFGIGLLKTGWFRTTELAFLCFILLSLSLVDAKIRKIPNQLLIALVALRLVALTYGTITGGVDGADWLNSAIGAVVGWMIFTIPGMFGLMVGWGDVKFAAVSGLYLEIIGMVQAMLVMSLIILIYGLTLVISKKGNFKTAVAYGPALSVGIVVTTLLPLAERLI